MDRIIYFYVTKERSGHTCDTPNPAPCRVHRYRRRDYELVRVGLEPWLVKRWETPESAGQAKEKASAGKALNILELLFGGISRVREKKRREKAAEEEGIFWRQQFELMIGLIQREEEKAAEDYESRFACDEILEKLLNPGENCHLPAGDIWRQIWRVPKFDEYREAHWIQHLMQYAAFSHFIVIGYHPALPRLLCLYADKMKSLKWILPEGYCSVELQEFLEDFYEEYGLAATVQVLAPGETCRRARISCREPSNILDFSGEEQIPTGDIARESIWLDMDSSDEKQRRMESRNTGIYYYSLKKEWKQPVLP